MTWALRTSDHGSHMVYKQQAVNSCGIACVIMVNFKVKKWQLAAAALTVTAPPLLVPSINAAMDSTVKSEKEVDAAYARVTGTSYDGSTYTDATRLIDVLNELNMGTWVCEWCPSTQVADKLVRLVGSVFGTPVIALLTWRSGAQHFVVCDSVVRTGGKPMQIFATPGMAQLDRSYDAWPTG